MLNYTFTPAIVRARIILGLFTQHETLTTTQMARVLGLAPRTVRDLVAGWLKESWLEIANPSRRARRYRLTADYRRIIGGLSAE